MEVEILPTEINFTKEVVKAAGATAAISAASVLGAFGAILLVGKVAEWNDARKTKKTAKLQLVGRKSP